MSEQAYIVGLGVLVSGKEVADDITYDYIYG